MENEIWKPIEGYDGYYEVSNHGRVRSWKSPGPSNKRSGQPTILKPSFDEWNKYLRVNLRKNGQTNRVPIHRLVAMNFVKNPNPNIYDLVLHIDDDPLNNYSTNLKWGDHVENMKDREVNSHICQGENSGNAKLSKEDVIEMRCAYRLGCFTYDDIAIAYDIGKATASDAIKGRTWSHV